MDTGKICDLCNGREFEIICGQDRKGRPLDTSMCLKCGLVGHAKLPSEEELAQFYAAQYRKDYHGETQPSPRRVWRAWLKGERVLRQLTPYLKPNSSIFEVGAGLGCTVKVLELAGHDASGLEPGQDFQEYSARQLRARVIRGEFQDYRPTQTFDLVLFVHVIEHLLSPRAALQRIHKMLKPGGKLYLECPSLGVFTGRISELFHFAHLYTFTPIPLLTLLKQCGFTVEKCFSSGVGCNHKFLLTRTEPEDCAIDPASVAQTREFLTRYQAPWHRVGLGYLRGRMRRIMIYLKEYLFANRAVADIHQRCHQDVPKLPLAA